ncbi:sensory protein with histidine kinase domain [Marinomonas sp. MED121]|uniref:GGDEF domain-containing protein n=1 Tax=Marinomonas sp. MED121 TaxID=314277 RepID=UPI000068FB18|nr:GGDEF domain-containing protein [Marinomonas sp. MED121]EAQ65037.1 sensory protein with histidine kinase domain [Marinomonas sp. MED121]
MTNELSEHEMQVKIAQLEQQLDQVRNERDAMSLIYDSSYQILHYIAEGAPTSTIFDGMMDQIDRYFPSYQACLMLVDETGAQWRIEAGTGIEHDLATPSGVIEDYPMQYFTSHLEQSKECLLFVPNLTQNPSWSDWNKVLNQYDVDVCIAQPFEFKDEGLLGYMVVFAPSSESQNINVFKRLLDCLMHMLNLSNLRQNAQTRLLNSANHDPSTGLANRYNFNTNFSMMLKDAKRHFQRLSVIVIEANQAKDFSAPAAEEVKDSMLKVVAKRLQKSVRDNDLLARFTDSEFVMALRIKHLEDSEIIANKILQSMEEPVVIDGQSYKISLSLGISYYPEHSSFSELYSAANNAKNNATETQKYCIEYHGRFCRNSADLYDF